MKSSLILGTLGAAFALLMTMTQAWAQDTRTQDVKFARGTSSASIDDSITGYQSVIYRVGVSAGQTMSVQLDTDNASSYFNITAPGASAALFVGSISGNSTTFTIPSSGTYEINVYLMRNAARRSETANYELTISVGGKAAARVPVAAPADDFADGLSGGPDYWQVHGLAGGDTLNVRSAASSSARVLGRVIEGDVVRNRGCKMNGSTRWCQIEASRGLTGWVSGKYLHESTRPARPNRPKPQPAVVQNDGISTAQMPRFCAGEASAHFGVRPQEITTNTAFKSGQVFVSQGWFDGAGGTTFFNCYFGADGSFIAVN